MNEPTSVSFQGTLAPEDLAAAMGSANRRSWLHRLLVGWFLLLLIIFATAPFLGVQSTSWPGIILPIGFLAWFLAGPRIRARSLFKQHKHLGELGTYEFNEDGIRISHPSLEVRLPWSTVSLIVECKQHYLIYTAPHSCHVIPRRFLSDERAWLEVVTSCSGKSIKNC